jgi:hypothetical protein
MNVTTFQNDDPLSWARIAVKLMFAKIQTALTPPQVPFVMTTLTLGRSTHRWQSTDAQ